MRRCQFSAQIYATAAWAGIIFDKSGAALLWPMRNGRRFTKRSAVTLHDGNFPWAIEMKFN
jgi:hypothetical protein